MSAAPPRAMRARSLPSDGSSSASVAPPSAARQSPPISTLSVGKGMRGGKRRSGRSWDGLQRPRAAALRHHKNLPHRRGPGHQLLPRQALRHLRPHPARGLGRHLRGARRAAGQRRRGDARRDRDAGVARRADAPSSASTGRRWCATSTGSAAWRAATSASASPTTRRSAAADRRAAARHACRWRCWRWR